MPSRSLRLPHRIVALAAAAALLAPLAAAAAAADEDPVVQAFAPEMRAMLARDTRCGEARVAATKFAADLTDGANAVATINALEKCLALPRTPTGWEDYTAYLLTADAAASLAAARLSRSQRVYDRARAYAERVPGYSLTLAGGHENSTYMARGAAIDPKTGQQPSNNDSPGDASGVVRYQNRNTSTASSGPTGLAKIASEIGYEATHPQSLAAPAPAASPSPKP